MTRHNLDVHISWLLSHKVTPPAGVHARAPTAHNTSSRQSLEEEEEFRDIPEAPPSPPRNLRAPRTVDVAQNFARPALPASVTVRSQLQEARGIPVNDSMGRLTSAPKSSRPGLMSQHQLATPASTTSTTAGSSSLSRSYSTFLREGNGSCRKQDDGPIGC